MSSTPGLRHRRTGRPRYAALRVRRRIAVHTGPTRPAQAGVSLLPGDHTTARWFRFAATCLCTLVSLSLGVIAILLTLHGQLGPAAAALIACIFLDGFDGLLARRLGVSSPFGAQLDSLADLTSFGLATSVLAYAALVGTVSPVVAAGASVLAAACAAMRLARFNVGDKNSRHFSGLPSSMLAGAVGTTVMLDPPVHGAVLAAGLCVLALAMVSRFPYPSFGRLIDMPLWLWAVILGAAALLPGYFILLASVAYLFSGPGVGLYQRLRGGSAGTAGRPVAKALRFGAAVLTIVVAALPLDATAARAAAPNPVVLIHGLNSGADRWAAYQGPDGFLSTIDRIGFAVGDGQAPGVLRMGSELETLKETNTIAQNAEILRGYIDGVKQQTGAERVDIVAHSMGGLVARYYIDRLMQARDVDRLIMLGTPNGGSQCAYLPTKLGLSVPSTVELRPSYVTSVFNQQITDRKGVAFFALAGDAVTQSLRSPCAAAPSDLVVGVESVEAVGVTASRLPLLHNDLKENRSVFEKFVVPALAEDISVPRTAEPSGPPSGGELQTLGLATGHVSAGDSVEEVIDIDDVTVATFAVYDPTRSLTVSVRGASGKTIELSAAENGLVKVEDPESLLYLGYGFENPQPGPWRVTLHATAQTPPAGADYALSAQVQGGAELEVQASDLLPKVGSTVLISAAFAAGGTPITVQRAVAVIRTPDGREETVTLIGAGAVAGEWRPSRAGLHSIDIAVVGESADGQRIERAAFLAADVQESRVNRSWVPIAGAVTVAALVLAVAVAVLVAALLRRAVRRRNRRNA